MLLVHPVYNMVAEVSMSGLETSAPRNHRRRPFIICGLEAPSILFLVAKESYSLLNVLVETTKCSQFFSSRQQVSWKDRPMALGDKQVIPILRWVHSKSGERDGVDHKHPTAQKEFPVQQGFSMWHPLTSFPRAF